jgi:hypothetical protein
MSTRVRKVGARVDESIKTGDRVLKKAALGVVTDDLRRQCRKKPKTMSLIGGRFETAIP